MAAALLAVAPLTGRRVTEAGMLRLLWPLQVSFGLHVLKPVRAGEVWDIYGRVNPEQQDPTGVRVDLTEPGRDTLPVIHRLATEAYDRTMGLFYIAVEKDRGLRSFQYGPDGTNVDMA